MKFHSWLILGAVALTGGFLLAWWLGGGPVVGAAGGMAGGIAAWILGALGRRKRPDLAGSVDREERAKREAQLELDAAVERGLAHRAAVDAAADKEVANATDILDIARHSGGGKPDPADDD